MNKLEKIKWEITKFLYRYRIISRQTAINMSMQMALKRVKKIEEIEKLEQMYKGVCDEERNNNQKSSS